MSPCGHFFRSRDPRPAGSGGAEGEHPLDVPCHGHEAPLATHLVEPAQQELAESEDRFDDAEHWFRDLFTQRIELPAFWRFQPIADLAEHRFELLLVVRGLNNIDGNHQKTALRHCSLRVVALLETAAGYRHDARLFIGEIDLIGKQRTLRRGPRRLAAWLLARGRSLGLPRCEFGLMLGLLAREAFFAARLDLGASFGDFLQAIFAPRQLVGY